MKKILLLSFVVLSFIACGPKQAQESATEGTDSIINIDTVTGQGQVADSTAIVADTAVVKP